MKIICATLLTMICFSFCTGQDRSFLLMGLNLTGIETGINIETPRAFYEVTIAHEVYDFARGAYYNPFSRYYSIPTSDNSGVLDKSTTLTFRYGRKEHTKWIQKLNITAGYGLNLSITAINKWINEGATLDRILYSSGISGYLILYAPEHGVGFRIVMDLVFLILDSNWIFIRPDIVQLSFLFYLPV
jgi:hypothetical protein